MATGIRTLLHAWKENRKQQVFQARQKKQVNEYLQSHTIRKLQIGGSYNLLEGWLNTDYLPYGHSVVFLDARKPFPFEDFCFDFIFSEHVLPHLSYSEAQSMLSECFRILKPGGKIRTAVPNLEFLIELFGHEKSRLQEQYVSWFVERFLRFSGKRREVFVINQFFGGWGLKFIYDPVTLEEALFQNGFREICPRNPGESEEIALRGIEKHGEIIGEEFNLLETFVLEATKPRPV